MGQIHALQGVGSTQEPQTRLVRVNQTSRLVATDAIESLAELVYKRADLRVQFPDPLLLARANGFVMCPAPDPLQCWSSYTSQILYYKPIGERRQRGYFTYHELAHGLFTRLGIPHAHDDVHELTTELVAPRQIVATLLKNRSAIQATRLLIRSNPHAPTHLLRRRIESLRPLADLSKPA